MSNNPMSMEELVPFNANLFADRQKAIQIFLETLRTKPEQRYLEFTGVAGQGKTELLKYCCYKAKEESYFSAYIDFEQGIYYRPEIAPVLQRIAECLAAQGVAHALSSQTAQKSDLLQVFNEKLLREHHVLLCFDSTEKALPSTLHNMEEQLIKRHLDNFNLMLMTAGQEPFVWRNIRVKDRFQRHPLPLFDGDDIVEQVKKLAEQKGFRVEDNEYIAKKIAELTLGHPYSNYTLIEFWTDRFNKGRQLNQSIVEDLLKQSVHILCDDVLDNRILGKVQWSKEYPSIKDVLRYLAPLRHFELSAFRYMLCTFWPEVFEGKPLDFFQRLIGEFRKTYIFDWQEGGFQIDPVVRNILLWDMRVNNLDCFLEIQEHLSQQYHEWAAKTHEATQIKNIVERLYHSTMYILETEPNYLNKKIQNEIQCYLETYFTVASGDAIALYDHLNRFYNTLDRDEELKKLVDMPTLLEKIDHKRSMIK